MIAPDLNAIPAYLTDLPGWMGSRTEVRGGKPTKVPKTARNTNADSTNPTTWVSFDTIAAVLQCEPGLFDGPDIALGDLGNGEYLCGVDLDDCLMPMACLPSGPSR
jgi:primase-polymerase (primpol)-like protein